MSNPRRKARETGESCLCLHLRKASRSITALYDGALAPAGLKITQFSLLSAVAYCGNGPLSELSKALGMDRTTLTRNLVPLLRAGLLEVKPGKDRRERLVSLSTSGHASLNKAYPLWEKANDRVLDRFGGKRSRKLFKELDALAEIAADRQ